MQCPVCHVDLVMSDRQGVEIDYCPKCRGVWLDRGELDKIIERADNPSQPVREERSEYRPRHEDHNRDHDYDERSSHGHHKKKKGGLLGDLFEFGD